jgi:signal transduction histidine kinase/ligand-binding sensor domain-containing protein
MYQGKRLLELLLLIITFPALHAQDKYPFFFKKCPLNTINYEQGLLNNQSTCILTDALGSSWVSTSIGLQRYNGYNLVDINPIVGKDTISIKSPVFLFGLRDGRVWISFKKGVLEYDPVGNVFKMLISLPCSPGENFALVPLKETAEGVWCMQESRGLVIFSMDGRQQKAAIPVDTLAIDQIIKPELPSPNVVTASSADHIFIRIGKRQVLRVNTVTRRCDTISGTDGDIQSISCNAHSLYIATTQSLSRYSMSEGKFMGRTLFKGVTDQPVRISVVNAIGNGRVIAGVNNQLLEYDGNLSRFSVYTTLDGSPIVPAGEIQSLYYDAFERIWVLTNDYVKRIQDRETPFTNFKYPGPAGNFVRCLYLDERKHQLLVGCLNGGLELYDTAANPLWSKPLLTREVKDILAIEKLSGDTYLVVTWKRGWYLLDLPKKKLSTFDFSREKAFRDLLDSNVFTNNLQRINDSTILVVSQANVFRCVFNGCSLRSVQPVLPFMKNPKRGFDCLFYSRDGTLWVGSYDGVLYKMDKKGALQRIPLPENYAIRCITEDAAGHIWIGSNSGLYVCTSDGRLLNSFFRRSGLLNDCIYSLLPRDSGSSVIASNNLGLSAVSLQGAIQNYTKESGLQDNEFNTNAALKAADGKLYFGGINGITAFFDPSPAEPKKSPVLNITRLVVNDSSYTPSTGIWEGDTINLRYDENHLEMDFAAMGISNADKYLYKYRLVEFEKNWKSTHQPTGIRYFLQSGQYLFEISCGDILSGQGAIKKLVIIIQSPWWSSWWFLLGVGLVSLSALVLVLYLYQKRTYRKRLQDLLMKQRLQAQRERISRDLHDNLGVQANAIFYGTELLMQNTGVRENLIGQLHDTAKDMLLVLRETLWAMKSSQVETTELWMRILNFIKSLGSYYPGVKITAVEMSPERSSLGASTALNIILIVQEAINNSVRHAHATWINVRSEFTMDGGWKIEITDDGKGFDLAAVRERPDCYGLDNMAGRAKESGLGFEIISAPASGTRVVLMAHSDHFN